MGQCRHATTRAYNAVHAFPWHISRVSSMREAMVPMRAGQAIIEMLRAENCEYTFGLVGTTTNSIVTEMYDRSDIRFVDTRHEEGAAFMAYGYARASGNPPSASPLQDRGRSTCSPASPWPIRAEHQCWSLPATWHATTSIVTAARPLTWWDSSGPLPSWPYRSTKRNAFPKCCTMPSALPCPASRDRSFWIFHAISSTARASTRQR